jgi:hypothetical protein
VRELVLYLYKVIDAKVVSANRRAFNAIIISPRMKIPYINMWVCSLFEHDAFGTTDRPPYDVITSLRDQALVARRRSDRTWVKDYKNGIDVLGPWEKRAVLYAADVLSEDEAVHWMQAVAAGSDILESAVAKHVIAEKRTERELPGCALGAP